MVGLKGGIYIEDCVDYIEGLDSAKSADVLLASMSQRRSSLVVDVMYVPDRQFPLLGFYLATSNLCNPYILQVHDLRLLSSSVFLQSMQQHHRLLNNICMYACMYVCMYVRVCVHACMDGWVDLFLYGSWEPFEI